MEDRSDLALIYFASGYIVDFVTRNPINWHDKDLACRNGPGDRAGIPPTPSVREFLRLLSRKQDLFTQLEYADFCCYEQWRDWFESLEIINAAGVVAKLCRNFYPSMIDSLHAWSILSESGKWDRCILDSYADCVGKTDLTLWQKSSMFRVALIGPTQRCRTDRDYKVSNRNGDSEATMVIQMPGNRNRSPGNKRWYEVQDFTSVLHGNT